MLKRTGLILLLGFQLGWAAPIPPPPTPSLQTLERPGNGLAPQEVDQLLNRYEKAAGPKAALDVECLRLLPLLRSYDPGCPPRVARLRQQLETLRPGLTRARCLWVLCWDAMMRHQFDQVERYARQALSEPALTALQKAFWMDDLDQAGCGQLPALLRNSMIADLSAQHQRHPQPGLLYVILSMRSRTARLQGNQEMESTLLLACQHLAQREGWIREQLQSMLNARKPGEKHQQLWSQLLNLALQLPASPKRDARLRQIMPAAPGAREWNQAASHLQQPLPPLEVQSSQLRFLTGQARLEQYASLLRSVQQSGQVEDEISLRQRYSDALEQAGQLEASLRQLRAALQCRLDHPLSDPDWTAQKTEYLAMMLCRKLEKCGRTQQQVALARQALEQGWCDSPVRQTEFHLQLCEAAQAGGDHQGHLEHWQAALERVPHLPADVQGFVLLNLVQIAPAEKEPLKPELLRRARSQCEAVLHSPAIALERSNALATLKLILKQQGETRELERLLETGLNHARQSGESEILRDCSQSLLQLYADEGSLRQLKELAEQRLQDPGVNIWERSTIYALAPKLAQTQDPQALIWADQGVQLARNNQLRSWSVSRALVHQARVQGLFQRYEAAHNSLDEAAGLKPGGAQRVELAQAEAEVLWQEGRQAQAVEHLRQSMRAVVQSEQPAAAPPGLRSLVEYEEKLGLDWQADLEQAVVQLQQLGERAQGVRRQVLFDWLQRLAQEKKWQEGREVLQRHPWGEGMESAHQPLLQYPEWGDLLPRPASKAAVNSQSLPAVLDSLRLGNPQLGQLLTLRSTNIRHLQARLGSNDTLATYCRCGDDLYLLALRHDGGFWRKTTLSEGQFKDLLARTLARLGADQPGPAEATMQSSLLAPLLQGEGRQCLYLVPTGPLWQVPFAALRDARGRPASSQADVVMLSSGDLLRLADGSWQPYRLSQPLAIGAPSRSDLPGAYGELEEVARMLPGCVLRRGSQATSEVLYDPGQRWGLLHFASHARYDMGHPLESEIELSDGPLKLRQFSQLSLAERSLVTLSCCHSGSSQGQELDEPVTLATGFSAAGADTVVANLWSVDDSVSRVFFTDFYSQLASGATPLSSFRHAQEHCRRVYPRATDWGGFFLLGNPT